MQINIGKKTSRREIGIPAARCVINHPLKRRKIETDDGKSYTCPIHAMANALDANLREFQQLFISGEEVPRYIYMQINEYKFLMLFLLFNFTREIPRL